MSDVRGFYAALGVHLPDKADDVSVPCFMPSHEDPNPSASIDTATGQWKCHGCDVGGGPYHAALAGERHLPSEARELAKRFGLWLDGAPRNGNRLGREV